MVGTVNSFDLGALGQVVGLRSDSELDTNPDLIARPQAAFSPFPPSISKSFDVYLRRVFRLEGEWEQYHSVYLSLKLAN